MTLKNINIKESYDSAVDDVVNDFYVPVLKETKYYDRIAGFFTSSSLTISSKGILEIAENGGHIRMLVSPRLDSKDVEIINSAMQTPELYISDVMVKELLDNELLIVNEYRNLMAHLIAKNILDIKVVLVKKDGKYLNSEEVEKTAIFHQKVGILKDDEGNVVTFSGSINESFNAWNGNIEEFKTFKSWEGGQNTYCTADIKKFDDYWYGMREKTETIDLPSAIKQKYIEISKTTDFKDIKERIILRRKNKKVNGIFDSLFWYQKEAVEKWDSNNRKLLFNMATGTGKTRTALACIDRVNSNENVLSIIATPQTTLSKQWYDEINRLELDFGEKLICDSTVRYKEKLSSIITRMNLGMIKRATLFTTHSTACSPAFIGILTNEIKKGKYKVLFVGDEVHGLGSNVQRNSLLELYNYRIGLSATPSRWYDEVGSEILLNYFGTNNYEFGIDKAIKNINPLTGKTFLTPYNYYPIKVSLTLDEEEHYEQLSKQISKCRGDDENIVKRRERLLQLRADIIKDAENKIEALKELIEKLKKKGRIENTIVFVSPKLLIKTMKLLNDMEISAFALTKDQDASPSEKYNGISERENIIQEFKRKNCQVIVAIKCMDEGIDIPSADTAILVSSTTNPREYIQRIGRVIRRYNNKKYAEIYDFVANSKNKEIDKTIMQNEMRREEYIVSLASNSIDAIKVMYDD